MPKLVFFVGPAGAGKTTLAKAMARCHPAAFLDMDTLLQPAAETIMLISNHDPKDCDSPLYKQYCREARNSAMDEWKLENWSSFSQSLTRRIIQWKLPGASILYYDNSGPLVHNNFLFIERFIYG